MHGRRVVREEPKRLLDETAVETTIIVKKKAKSPEEKPEKLVKNDFSWRRSTAKVREPRPKIRSPELPAAFEGHRVATDVWTTAQSAQRENIPTEINVHAQNSTSQPPARPCSQQSKRCSLG